MQRLVDLQSDFASAIRDTTKPVPASVAHQTDGQIATKRFAVYRNNVHVSLIEALRTQFPAIERLVGEEFFKALARVYVENNLPKSPLMFKYGHDFPDFLESFDKVAELPYLADVARIDYARTEAYHAADADPLTLQDLAQIPQNDFANLAFQLHPSMHVIASPFPVYTIWRANNGSDEEVPEISLDQGSEDVMIIRPALSVEAVKLPPGAAEFILALSDERNIAEALEAALSENSDFDFAGALPQLAQSGLFISYEFDSSP